MSSNIKIAIIDSGMDETLIDRERLEHKLIVDEDHHCRIDDSRLQDTVRLHGTICALIIEKYCPDCVFSSIRILDSEGNGGITKIAPALEWCYQNNVTIVNLSIGTTHFKGNEKLNKLINKYVYKGLIIVAAISNIGFFTYPASFTNVIGVSTMDSPLRYMEDDLHLGIDAVVPSQHIIKLGGKEHRTSLSNSYAAPYASALIMRKWMKDNDCNVYKLKKYIREKSHMAMKDSLHNPDWIYRAYMQSYKNDSKADYYFEAVTGSYEDLEHEVDTVIVCSREEWEQIDIGSKNLVYLGSDSIEDIHLIGFKWSWDTRVRQILGNQFKGKGLDIPLIILEIEASLDKYDLLTQLRQSFAKGGYHSYIIGMETECVLYGFEYIPEIQAPLTEQLVRNFIEGQVFYKKNDLILWNIAGEQKEVLTHLYPDYDVEIIFDGTEVMIYIEKNLIYNQAYHGSPEEQINVIYGILVNYLSEEGHEQ